LIKDKIITTSPTQTRRLGKNLARKLHQGSLVALCGSLGSGKTTMIKGICQGLGIKELVRSPCFVIMTQYQAKLPVYHFDLYRLKSPEELHTIGYEEYFYGDGICLVEWAEKARNFLPDERIEVYLKIVSNSEREIEINEVKTKTQKKIKSK
jgi:tRNA threonylcarbamoyladenosine biosynthesis protein TsaE